MDELIPRPRAEIAPGAVRAVRIAMLVLQPGQHCRQRLGRERSRRLVIEIGHAANRPVARAIARQAWPASPTNVDAPPSVIAAPLS